MINQATFCLNLTKTELQELVNVKDWTGVMWDKPPSEAVEEIKSKIRAQLEAVQTCCAYCGLKLKGTSKGQIEHIAPKAYYRYPQFTFTLRNLVMACNFCNGFDKKGTTPTISSVHNRYKRCEFNILHPYFDDPSLYYDWDDQGIEILISINTDHPDHQKALNSMALFDLDTPKMNELRAQQVRFEEYKSRFPLNNPDETLLNDSV